MSVYYLPDLQGSGVKRLRGRTAYRFAGGGNDMQANRTALALAALAYASGAFAQSTSTTMDMGGGMTHVDTMGPNGAMSSSNCMNMGGGMATCNTMDMSQPQRTYPTPDMSRPQTNGTALNFVGDLVARSRERSFQKKIHQLLESGDCVGATIYAHSYHHEALSDQILRSCHLGQLAPAAATPDTINMEQSMAAMPVASISGVAVTPIVPAPMSIVSSRPIPIPDWVKDRELAKATSDKAASFGKDSIGTEYTVNYLGHTLLIEGFSGMTIEVIRLKFENIWRDNPWVEYSSTDAGTVYYFSITSEKIYSDRIEIWTKADHSKDRTTKARSTMALFEIRCNQQEMRELQQTQYEASGKVLLSFDQPATLSRVIPETVGSALLDEACKVM
jgi:hypothetical protein